MYSKQGRRNALKLHDHKYKHLHGERGKFYYLCVYCGQPASEKDHVPPITRVDDYKSLNLEHEIYIKVPSCRQCNLYGADVLDETFVERAERIKDRIARKHSKFLSPIEWDDDEIEELDYTLKTKVLEHNIKADKARLLLEYYTGIDEILAQLEV